MPPASPPDPNTSPPPTPVAPPPAHTFGQPVNPAPITPPPVPAAPPAFGAPTVDTPAPSPAVKEEVAHMLSEPPSGPPPVPYGSAQPKRSKLPLIIVIVVLLLLGAGGFLVFKGIIKLPVKKATAPAQPPAPAAPTVTTETINDAFSLVYIPHPGATQTVTKMKLSLSAPTSLRTQVSNRGCRSDFASSLLFQNCETFSFANTLGGNQDLSNRNTIEIDEVTNWLPVDEKGSFPPLGLVKATDKQTKINFILGLKSTTDFSKITTDQLPSLVGNAGYVGGIQRVSYVETTDKNFHGIALMTTPAQENFYAPQTLFIMAGKVGGETVLIRGNFQLNDKLSQKIAADSLATPGAASASLTKEITDAVNNFKAGKFESDLPGIDDGVRNIIKSLTLVNG